MSRRLKHIIFFFLFVGMQVRAFAQETILPAIQQQEQILKCHPEDTKALKELCFLYLYKSDYRKAIEYGEKLFQLGYKKQDYKFSILYAHIGLGQAYVMLGDTSAINHLGQAMLLAKSEKNDSALCSVYNGMGLYTSNIHKDYYSALHYFFEGIEAAHRCHYKELEAILLGNISSIYFLKEDPAGLTYSLQTYEMGHEQNSAYLIFIGALNASYMYYLLHDYDKALPYIKEAEFIMKQNEYYNQGNVYAIYGMIEFAKGNRQQAIEYYKKGLALNAMNQTSYKVLLLNEYAIALAEEGKNQQAIDLLFQALAFTKEENCEIYRNRVINTLSVCYENMGQYAEALAWQRRLQQETDSIFNTDKEKVLSELRIKYDTEHQANEIRKNKLILLQKEKKEQALIGILVIVLLVVFALWYRYRRQNQLYTSIVRQHQESIRKEQQLKEVIASLREQSQEAPAAPSVSSVGEKYAASSLTNEKKNSLFQRLENLMQEEEIYKENLLTKERVADLLGTNRTYLSQVINEQTQQNFTQYVNNYRINEAIRLLSDPETDIPLKAVASEVGFNSMSTFYKIFQNTVGIPPKQYRNKVMSMHKNVQ
ncbi:helix-turn-helix domain-containing protein [Bacteroides mediterraneensis]|uniref:helix-turn-helix domain-containing protein n=1 Tax=Bacteroides mediterraneensis TaxID=1841856 RepID=UPI0019590F09|nr:helix-turn-helix domain-containing protein [Bacteroides mediterraneensis]MBM6780940.1 helix-turn-helix domain-containing protein [Bacteroides mediterraneensis]